METNINLGQNIKNILTRNRCWTWYDDWKWFDTESFIEEIKIEEEITFGRLFPVNFIKVNIQGNRGKKKPKPLTLGRRIRKFLSR